MAKTQKELQAEIDLTKALKGERDLSDLSYAEKRVEAIVYGALKIILTALLMAVVGLVIYGAQK